MGLTKGRGRRWKPKYPCECTVCGWKGKRTKTTMYYPCPRCWPYLKGLSVNKKIQHIQAIRKTWRTVKRISRKEKVNDSSKIS